MLLVSPKGDPKAESKPSAPGLSPNARQSLCCWRVCSCGSDTLGLLRMKDVGPFSRRCLRADCGSRSAANTVRYPEAGTTARAILNRLSVSASGIH
jgi:hypothetical protein